jgi:hypothetical protein
MTTAILTKRHPSVIPHNHPGSEIQYYKTYECDSSVSVGDVVFLSQTVDNYVYSNTDNKESLLSIGIVISKEDTTTAKVQIFGDCSLTFTGLEQGKRVWLSSTGQLTTSVPTDGYVHIIGMCYENNKVFINPELNKLKRNPF